MSRLYTHGRTDGRTECEDRARILETEFAISELELCPNNIRISMMPLAQ